MDKELEEIILLLKTINEKLYKIANKLGCYEKV